MVVLDVLLFCFVFKGLFELLFNCFLNCCFVMFVVMIRNCVFQFIYFLLIVFVLCFWVFVNVFKLFCSGFLLVLEWFMNCLLIVFKRFSRLLKGLSQVLKLFSFRFVICSNGFWRFVLRFVSVMFLIVLHVCFKCLFRFVLCFVLLIVL